MTSPSARRSPVTHVYLWPSQWGQQACDHLLHHSVAVDVKVTLIVPARHMKTFRESKPTIKSWQQYENVADAIEQLKGQGRPIDYMSDLYVDAIRARMLREKAEAGVRSVVYVTSGAERHVRDAQAFADCADLILIEKPYSMFLHDLDPESWPQGESSPVYCADHYLFRPGVLLATESATPDIMTFLGQHRADPLRYTFIFEEQAQRDDPDERPGAYRDGAILDIAVVHGLGPIARILLPAIGAEGSDLESAIQWTRIVPMTGTDVKERPRVGTFAETGVELHGTLKLPPRAGGDGEGTTVDLVLRSVKGVDRFRRFFRFEVVDKEKQHSYGVSLGASGATVTDDTVHTHVYATWDGGEQSDMAGARSGAANAQAAMLRAVLENRPRAADGEAEEAAESGGEAEKGGERPDALLLTPAEAKQIVSLAYRAQGLAAGLPRKTYRWGGSALRDEDFEPGELSRFDVEDRSPARWRTLRKTKGIDLPGRALGLSARGEPLHRVITFLGEDGEGNGDLNRAIRRRFQRGKEGERGKLGKERCWAFTVQRDEGWARDGRLPPTARPYTLDVLIRDVAEFVGVSLPARPDPAEALRKHFEDEAKAARAPNGKGRRKQRSEKRGEPPLLLLLNGVGRLSRRSWARLARVLAAMGPRYRIVLLTNRPERAAGLVVRTEAAMGSLDDDAQPQDVRGDKPIWVPWSRGLSRQSARVLQQPVRRMAQDNVTLERQLRAFVEFVAMPWAGERRKAWSRTLVELVETYLAAASLPEALSDDSEALMDRFAALVLARLSPDERAGIRDLSIADQVSLADVVSLHPQLSRSLDQGGAVRALFELRSPDPGARIERRREVRRLFPRVRRVALTWTSEELQTVDDQVNRRLRILARFEAARDAGERDRMAALPELMKLVGGSDLASLPLRHPRFEAVILYLVDQLAGQSKGKSPPLAMDLVDLLVAEEHHETALGLSARAHLLALAGTMVLDSAGDDATRAHGGLQRLRAALEIARTIREDDAPAAHRTRLVGCAARLVFAELIQANLWERLFGDRGAFEGTFRGQEPAELLSAGLAELETDLDRGDVADAAYSWSQAGRGWRALSLYHYVHAGSKGGMAEAVRLSEKAGDSFTVAGDTVRRARSELEILLFRHRSDGGVVDAGRLKSLVALAAPHPALGVYAEFVAWAITSKALRGRGAIRKDDRPALEGFREKFRRTGQQGLHDYIDRALKTRTRKPRKAAP